MIGSWVRIPAKSLRCQTQIVRTRLDVSLSGILLSRSFLIRIILPAKLLFLFAQAIMNKFEELKSAFLKAKKEFEEYEQDVQHFAEVLWKTLIKYYGIPPTQANLCKINVDGQFDVVGPPVKNALNLNEELYWQMGFSLTISEDLATYPQETVLIGITFRREQNSESIDVNVIGDQMVFKIDPSKTQDYHVFLDHIFKLTLSSYHQGIQQFFAEEKTIRKIGYTS